MNTIIFFATAILFSVSAFGNCCENMKMEDLKRAESSNDFRLMNTELAKLLQPGTEKEAVQCVADEIDWRLSFNEPHQMYSLYKERRFLFLTQNIRFRIYLDGDGLVREIKWSINNRIG